MTHDDEKEALFLQYWPSLGCMIFFFALVVAGVVKWLYRMHLFHWKKTMRYVLRHALTMLDIRSKWLMAGWRRPVSRWALRVFFGHEKRLFIYEFEKALDCTAGSAWFGCLHDETISNKANTHWTAHGFKCKKWVIVVKTLTEHVHENHLAESAEPLRVPPLQVLQPRPAKPTRKAMK